jgi:protein-disulfide isomerase
MAAKAILAGLPLRNPLFLATDQGATVTAIPHPASRSSRRSAFLGLALAAYALFLGSSPVFAQATVPVDQLMAPGPLPDVVEGKADAPVTIVEYASMTCTHCAAFHAETWPTLKSKYIDTGKVKFILREFPLDPLAAAAFMLARCSGPEKRDAIVDLLFDKQKDWAFVDKPLEALAGLLKQTGVSQNDFETCLKNQDLYNKVTQTRDEAAKSFHVDATPTFYVNGQKLSGELPIADFDKVIAPLLK